MKKRQILLRIIGRYLMVVIITWPAFFIAGFIDGASGNSMAEFAGGTSGTSVLDHPEQIAESIFRLWVSISPIVYAVLSIISAVLLVRQILSVRKVKSMMEDFNADNEDAFDRIEKMNAGHGVAFAVIQPVSFILFVLAVYMFVKKQMPPAVGLLSEIMILISFSNYYLYARSVSMKKELNPERRGDVFSPAFMKEWLSSGDEYQKRIIYEAGFDAFRKMRFITLLLLVAVYIVTSVFQTGILPCVMLSIVWVTGEWAFARMQYRLEQGK